MVISIIDGLREYLAECPLLAEIPVKDRHINWTQANIDKNYGIFPDGNEPLGEPYINGTKEWEYTAQINVRKFDDTDLKRLKSSEWLERFQRWLAEQVKKKNFPEMPEGCTPYDIEAPNAMLLEQDETGKRSTYAVTVKLTYTTKN